MNDQDAPPGTPGEPPLLPPGQASRIGQDDAAPQDATIPMLTEVVTPARRTQAPPGRLGDEYWNRVAIEVQRSVLERLLRRTDTLLDTLLREEIGALVDRTAERLVADVRDALRGRVQDAVARAIAEELTRIHRAQPLATGDGVDPPADRQD